MDEYGQNQVLDLWESDQSDPEVQFALGQCYLRGAGVEQSGAEAEKWLRRAAEQGHEEAAALLRSVVEKPQPSREALTLDTLPDWCEAAEKGEAQAQYEIAAYFLNHPDPAWDSDVERYLSMAVEQEHPQACLLRGEMLLPGQPEQAVKLLRSAAKGGELRAMVLLGECYAQGKGVEQDLAQAEAWFVAAARRGSGEDMLKLALRYRTGDGVPRSQGRGLSWLRRAQRAGVDDAEARYYGEDWSRRQKAKERCVHRRRIRAGAEAGEPGAQRELGDLCLEELKSGKYIGEQAAERRRSAAEWFRRAAEQGDAQAQYRFAMCCWFGYGVERSEEEHLRWLSLAAEQGLAQAQRQLGHEYQYGMCVPQDWTRAAEWYRRAAEQGDVGAQREMAQCCRNGEGVEQSEEAWIAWLERAAEQKDAPAMWELARYCRQRPDDPQSRERGLSWLRRLAEGGDENAKKELVEAYAQENGAARDDGECRKYLYGAAGLDSIPAQVGLASLYARGDGVTRNRVEAAMWYLRAAELGDAGAQYAMACCYRDGQGVKKNEERYLHWLKKAAEQGHPEALHELDVYHPDGADGE